MSDVQAFDAPVVDPRAERALRKRQRAANRSRLAPPADDRRYLDRRVLDHLRDLRAVDRALQPDGDLS